MLHSAGWYLGVAFLVMQVVEVVFPYSGLPDAAGSAVLAVLVAGFPVALVVSWVFEITPPTFRREVPQAVAGRPSSGGEAAARSLDLRTDSIAVLPFENLTRDPEDAYFSDGVTEDIIASVGHIRGLRVMSRASSMRYRGLERGIDQIAAELGVGTLVMGSVRRSGTRVRVVAELVDTRSGTLLWSETYDRELEDIFEVQSDLAFRISRAIQRELSVVDRQRIESRGTRDAESYDLYLRGRFLWNQRTESSVSESITYFQRALEKDPRFALAHAGLADAFTVLAIYGIRDPSKILKAAGESAEAALAIEPNLGEAITSRACLLALRDWDWEVAEAEFERAIAAAPSYPTAYHWYAAHLLVPLRRFADARGQLRRASELDPVAGTVAVSEASVTFYSRDFDGATREFEALAKLHPDFALVHLFLGQSHEQLGHLGSATEALERAVQLSDESSEALAAYAHCLAGARRREEAEAILRQLEERASRRYVSPALIAQVLGGLGREEEALERLDEAARVRATDLIWLRVRPTYDRLRAAPRFHAIESLVGLA